MYTCYTQSFKILASFCSLAGWFESYLFENPRRHIFAWRGSNGKLSSPSGKGQNGENKKEKQKKNNFISLEMSRNIVKSYNVVIMVIGTNP